MNERQKKKLAMYEMVIEACDRRRFEWTDLPAFASAYQDFTAHVKTLRTLAHEQRRHTGGVAQTKLKSREHLCLIAHEISAAILASTPGRVRLRRTPTKTQATEPVSLTLTALRTGKDAVCLNRCQKILTSATTHLPTLKDYGITEDKLTELKEAIAGFSTYLPQLREIRTANKKHTARLPSEFDAIDAILYNRLDNLIPQFRSRAERFYADYTASRVMKSVVHEKMKETESEDEPMID